MEHLRCSASHIFRIYVSTGSPNYLSLTYTADSPTLRARLLLRWAGSTRLQPGLHSARYIETDARLDCLRPCGSSFRRLLAIRTTGRWTWWAWRCPLMKSSWMEAGTCILYGQVTHAVPSPLINFRSLVWRQCKWYICGNWKPRRQLGRPRYSVWTLKEFSDCYQEIQTTSWTSKAASSPRSKEECIITCTITSGT